MRITRTAVLTLLIIASLLVTGQASATGGDRNVYGDPGSSSYSTILGASAMPNGDLVVAGAFFGQFQGHTSDKWDLWLARIDQNREFVWIRAFDAPAIDNEDFSAQGNNGYVRRATTLTVANGEIVALVNSAYVLRARAADGAHVRTTRVGNVGEDPMISGDGTATVGIAAHGDAVVDQFALDGTREWRYTHGSGSLLRDMTTLPSGEVAVITKPQRQSFQAAAIEVTLLSKSGSRVWSTVLNGHCVRDSGRSMVQLGDTLAIQTHPADSSRCDVDRDRVVTLKLDSGLRDRDLPMKDALNLITCSDPTRGVVTSFREFGFVDGDECGGDPVWVVMRNEQWLQEGGPAQIEGIVVLERLVSGQATRYFGMLTLERSQSRWTAATLESIGRTTEFTPEDLVVAGDELIAVGAAANTAWVSTARRETANAGRSGAAATAYSVEAAAGWFLDDDESVFEGEIEDMAASRVTRGCNPPSNTRFCPEDGVTRGAMAAFLVRSLGLRSDATDWFRDDDDSIFEGDIQALRRAGITMGCNPPKNDNFCPDSVVTRQEMAAFLTRALKLPSASERFRDVSSDNTFARDIGALAEAGITRGCNPPANDLFCPRDQVTRGQMAAFLVRAGVVD